MAEMVEEDGADEEEFEGFADSDEEFEGFGDN
jgi:hypothetical protein